MLKISNVNYKWSGQLSKRRSTMYIILHHAAAEGSPESIHNAHLSNEWIGIGYNFYVRLNGDIFFGRPINSVGAHTPGYNSVSVGVCFEGNYEKSDNMPKAQLESGKALISYLKNQYPEAETKRHKDFLATACPGKYFPFEELAKGISFQNIELESVNDIVWELNHRNIMTDSKLWLEKCNLDTDAYWLARKAVNMTCNNKVNLNLISVNDIVWELNHRNIITNTNLWLKKLDEDGDLYWLAYKIANLTQNK